MNIAEYNLDYVRGLLAVGGWQGTDEELNTILQKANNKASFDLFISNLESSFYTMPKRVHESINFVTRKGDYFDEELHLNFVKKIKDIISDFFTECSSAECSFSSGYTSLDMVNDIKNTQMSVIIVYNESVQIHTVANGKNTVKNFSLKD